MVTVLFRLDKAALPRDTGDVATVIAGGPTMIDHTIELPCRHDGRAHAFA
ncbi:MAG: hypothetical protein ABI135_07295 [Rhodoferax sp.]